VQIALMAVCGERKKERERERESVCVCVCVKKESSEMCEGEAVCNMLGYKGT
jgi:hypothetical protein